VGFSVPADDFDDPTPPAVELPPTSPLLAVQTHAQGLVRSLGRRHGAKLDELESKAIAQAVWNEKVAGTDGTNGKVSRLEKFQQAVIAMAATALVTAGGALYKAGIDKGDQAGRIRQLELQVEKLTTDRDRQFALEQQLLLHLVQLPPAMPALNRTGDTP
jgi:hypothetical protein